MPSKAFQIFHSYSSPEVSSIIDIFEERNSRRGRNKDYALLYGNLMLLVSAWEVYCEEVSREAIGKLVESSKVSFDHLPASLQRRIIMYAYPLNLSHQDPLATKIAKLPGSGWKALLKEMLDDYLHDFNTPKFSRGKGKNLKELLGFYLGIDVVTELDAVIREIDCAKGIDRLISIRGAIAHKGMPDEQDRFSSAEMRQYLNRVLKVSAAIEYLVHREFRSVYGLTPWNIIVVPDF
ncbi:HEPN domain-containing protein [Chlorobium phaeovibrioides]|uniref:RiboL-PSP-HEPN domain-containing protein n=1 Tax=Chlorobium phaeovibrioides TaxID=1094 RepID=A0A3S0MPH3_CHLPH|nr:HEPN domain-containing protein [Chlorobium phaeovibrioides]MWV55140.1 hypothetical protein [Chlorobium phaeovibrioides]QEQ57439.1 hypothetical protein FNV82_07710 [Chlorobium phaeovibrioides]RTY35227.1 hypothetical protein EKD02_09385 [Chlorobium phaeovibrioides]